MKYIILGIQISFYIVICIQNEILLLIVNRIIIETVKPYQCATRSPASHNNPQCPTTFLMLQEKIMHF